MKKAGTILLAAALAVCLHMPAALADQPLDTISVSGVASKVVEPDMATVNLSYTKKGETVEEVRQAGAQVSKALLRTMLEQGIAQENISSVDYSISPVYHYDRDGRQKQDGYSLNAGWTVKVKNLAKLGTIIDQSLTTGVDQVSGVNFGLQNEDLIKNQLLGQAVQNARYSAQAVASAGGRNLGVLRQASIPSSSVVEAQPILMARLEKVGSAANDTTTLAPKALTITVRVNTLFALAMPE